MKKHHQFTVNTLRGHRGRLKRRNIMNKQNRTHGTSWKAGRVRRAAAGAVVAIVSIVGAGMASGNAGASTGWGKVAPTTVTPKSPAQSGPGHMSTMSTGWGD
jgi:hypothetical protein